MEHNFHVLFHVKKKKDCKQLFLKKFLGTKNFYILSTKSPLKSFIYLSYLLFILSSSQLNYAKHTPACIHCTSSFPTLFNSTYIYKYLELGTVLHTRDTKMNEMLSQLLRCSES